ncbi:hypothetical protein GIB67_038836 [Kingdonia uniflora]|uniref:HAT C-terminal dimerisation domain-containing protein n=1 Tax=Kingdonia uniflora TaxID=39325 RepID=A0A7J7M0S5_9MAGN|nr:hypothetical protein GIB67_038836 [Kingdonia uniflora]
MDNVMDFPTPSCPDSAEFRSPIPSKAMMSNPLESVLTFTFDQARARRETVRYFVREELPFNNVEKPTFHRWIKNSFGLQFKPLCRTTMRNDVMNLFAVENNVLKENLCRIPGKICFTSDMWTSNQQLGYLCLTAHFISNDWKLHKRIISFTMVPSPHAGHILCDVIYACLLGWNLTHKVSKISLLLHKYANDPYCRLLFESIKEINYGCETIESVMETCKTKLKYLFGEYQQKFCNDECDPSVAAPSLIDENDMVLALLSKRKASSNHGCVSDLQRYLDQISIKVYSNDSFNLLDWWKTNEGTYPILAVMVRDLLTIPTSTVASESAFSMGEQVLSKYGSCLLPETVEALICLKDWFQVVEELQNKDLHGLENLMGDIGL